MFRDQRLGEISGDVLDYLSSREADRRIFAADLLVDRAHLVMLKEQDLISGEVCSQIMAALDEIGAAAEPASGAGEDVHEAIEASILARIGPEGGRMHTGRSRNDEVATCIRLALRAEMLDLMTDQLSFMQTLVRLAAEHKETIIPGFTHTQHAQPTTLAHHLLAHADAAARDLARMEDAYARVNLSPLGAAAFASTGFAIDRFRTCRLLGFDGLVENSMDAVSTRDFILEVLADLSIMMVNLSRLAEELILWSTSEFGYLELDNLYASTSSIMPQKKNPDTAELARGNGKPNGGALHLQGPAPQLQPRPAGGHASPLAKPGLVAEHGAHSGRLRRLAQVQQGSDGKEFGRRILHSHGAGRFPGAHHRHAFSHSAPHRGQDCGLGREPNAGPAGRNCPGVGRLPGQRARLFRERSAEGTGPA
jgi:argininosuccinate lyase